MAIGQVHDAANRLLEDSNFTFSYDANGNLVEQISKANGDRTVYTYNVENQLIRVEKFTVPGGVSPVTTAAYRYDSLGRRITKEVTQAGTTVVTRYVYDNEDILLEFDGSNLLQARYTHGPGIDEPLIMLRGGQSFFYHADGLGSIWDLTDTAGTAIRSYTYDSFGQIVAQTGTLINPYTYTAREFDPETGLLYYRTKHNDLINTA
ncbi:MAG: RHS repeat domain-containing protein [Anaerolineae bacterium]